MNTRQAAKFSGITYRQLDYWISQGVISPTGEYGQGKAREFTRRDLVLLRLIAMLRADGYRIDALKDAIGLVNLTWVIDIGKHDQNITDAPDKAGMFFDINTMADVQFKTPEGGSLARRSDFFLWFENIEMLFDGETIHHMKKLYYSIRHIAQEVYRELDKPEP